MIVNAAAMLLESLPFLFLAQLLTRFGAMRALPYLNCGCDAGPTARSLPATLVTYFLFGPSIALARFLAAFVVGRFLSSAHRCATPQSPADSLSLLLLPACASALCVPLLGAIAGTGAPKISMFLATAVTAFVTAPCALGTIGIAAALRTAAPAAAAGFLCVAGIFDVRTWRQPAEHLGRHDFCAYAISALACAIVAVRGGATMVHPKIALALWPCAIALAALAWRHRDDICARLRIAPMVMLAGCVLAAPQPFYRATETTLTDAFPGERIDFTGQLESIGGATLLVRYAITCCRADAAPVAIRLANAPHLRSGWYRAFGTLRQDGTELELRVSRFDVVSPPADPFIYR